MHAFDIDQRRLSTYWNHFCDSEKLSASYKISHVGTIKQLLKDVYGGVDSIEELCLSAYNCFNRSMVEYDDEPFYWFDGDEDEIVWLDSVFDLDSPVVKYDYHLNGFMEYAVRLEEKRNG